MISAQVVTLMTWFFIGEIAQTDAIKMSSPVQQVRRFVSVKTGDSLTLQCFCDDVVDARFYWYKLNLGEKPKLISTFYKYESGGYFHDEFGKHSRFTLDTDKGKNHLTINNLLISDSGTYYCASSHLFKFEFAEGTTVIVKGSSSMIQAEVHQSSSETIQPGDSVTLNCTVHTGGCDGEHSVYWFKDSEESHPALIYTHGGRNDQCGRKRNSGSHTCFYNMLMKNLNVSHAGTYYCAVASCGQILFGNKTKLDLTYEVNFVSYFWCGALAFTSILCVLLAFSVCLMNKKSNYESSVESKTGLPRLTTDAKGYLRAENIYCPTLSANLTNRSRTQRDPTWSECVYYTVKP
ncbi:uncharacterized protein LOC133419959 isoform X2 [Cololabis saira]|uniref:uncharacterized protein LOC133419959 isoform X2 n=1 Tax=Cololabis saira TaxID=129043 RepID=UPI002AD4FFEF|nr:uncharacterized protein LOC133419959 isoform X2 [Cololabis saira]